MNEVLNFDPGSGDGSTACVNITINEDVFVEGNETFSVELSLETTGLGVTLGNSEGTVVITDKDGQL